MMQDSSILQVSTIETILELSPPDSLEKQQKAKWSDNLRDRKEQGKDLFQQYHNLPFGEDEFQTTGRQKLKSLKQLYKSQKESNGGETSVQDKKFFLQRIRDSIDEIRAENELLS